MPHPLPMLAVPGQLGPPGIESLLNGLNNSPDAILICNSGGKPVFANTRFTTLFNVMPADLANETITDIQNWLYTLAGNLCHTPDSTLLLSNPQTLEQEYYKFDFRTWELPNEDSGTFYAWREITQQVVAEQKARRQSERLEAVFAAHPDAFFFVDERNQIVEYQGSWATLFGKDGAMMGRKVGDVFPGEVGEDFERVLMQVRAMGRKATLEYSLQVGGFGEKRFFETRLVPLENHQVMAVVRDITTRMRSELALQASETLYRGVVEDQTDLIFRTTHSGIVEFVNNSFCRYFQVQAEHFLGTNILDYMPWHLRQEVLETVDRCAKARREQTYQYQGKLVSGETAWQEWLVRPIFNTWDDSLMGFQSVGRDISALKRTEIALRESKDKAEAATRAKSEFLATLSHEIRTPLNGVIAASSLLLTTTLNAEQSDYADTIRHSGECLMGLLNNILDFSKIESGNLVLEERVFDVRDLVKSTAEIFRPSMQEKHLLFDLQIAAETPASLSGDPIRIRQVLVNLLGNAVKFTFQGAIRVSVQPMEHPEPGNLKLHFAVADSGIGIPPDKFEKLFKPFSQVDSSITRRFGGTGLGLAIVHRLVELMNGEVWAESAPGVGSTFHFTVQLSPQPPSTAPDAEKAIAEKAIAEAITEQAEPLGDILVVEDNPVNRRLMVQVLAKLGHNCQVAENGWDALKLLETNTFACVLLDMQMPEMDGLSLARVILDLYPERPPYLVAITASTTAQDRERCMAAGIHAFLPKPVRIHEVRQALRLAAAFNNAF